MKNTLLILTFAVTSAISSAQTDPNKTVRRVRPVAAPVRKNPAKATPINLNENITLHLEGNFQGFIPLDIELTGNGNRFQTELVTPSSEKETGQPTIISFHSTVTLNPDNSYQVQFNLGARIAFVSNQSTSFTGNVATNVATNVEYRDIELNGSAKLTQGKPLTISKLNGHDLKLTIKASSAQD